MAGLFSLLSLGATSLQAQQAYTATVSHNLSNSNTAGYARQSAVIATVQPAERFGTSYLGRGAMLETVTQARDQFLEAQLPSAFSQSEFSKAQVGALSALNALDPDNGLSTAIAGFYSAMRATAQDPGSRPYREAALAASTQLALAFNRVGNQVTAARAGLDQQVGALLPSVNEAASQLASLNAQIRSARAAGGSPNDLLDARQRLADQLAQQLGATPVASGEGDLNLVLPGGTALVSADKASTLSTLADPANGGHLAVRVTLPDGSGPFDLSTPLGGQLGGLIDARDGALKTAQTGVDQLAFDFAGAVNTVHQAGFALDGSTGRDLFVAPTAVTGAASKLAVNQAIASNVDLLGAASSATTVPGDGRNLQALVATEDQALSTGLSVVRTLASVTASYGAAVAHAQQTSDGDEATLGHLTQLRASVSGVNTDEELVNLTQAQRAYEAIAKVIKTTDSLLETLMQLK